MKKDYSIFLKHILESIQEIEKYIINISIDDFAEDIKTQDAAVRRIEIIGEAVKNLPSDFKNKHKDINWKEIAGMRDVLIHEYFGVDIDIVWETIKKDLPELKIKVSEILKILKK